MRKLIFKSEPVVEDAIPDDAAHLREIMRSRGFDVSVKDCAAAWKAYSDTLCAGWLSLPDDDSVALILQRYLVEEEEGQPAHDPVASRKHNDRNWEEITISFVVHDEEAPWNVPISKWPPGWALSSTGTSHGRCLATFQVDHMPQPDDARRVAAILWAPESAPPQSKDPA